MRILAGWGLMEVAMYKVYSGPRGSQGVSPVEKDRLLFKQFGSLDEAMNWAGHVNRGGRVALLIEGDDGTHLSKSEIAAALGAPEDLTGGQDTRH